MIPTRLQEYLEGVGAKFVPFRTIFPDCEIGTMPPLGRLHGMRTIVDSRLGAEEAVTFQAGSHEDALRMSWREFARIESPTTRDITSARKSP